MRASLFASLSLAAGTAHAFSDSFPFVLFSTKEVPSQYSSVNQLQSSSHVLAAAKDILGRCPTSKYLLVSQPQIHASDLRGPYGCQAPNLCRALASSAVHGLYSVAEVVPTAAAAITTATENDASGSLSLQELESFIKASCESQGRQGATVRDLQLPSLPVSKGRAARVEALGDSDYLMGHTLDTELADGDVTVVYFSTPSEHAVYEAEFEDSAMGELKKRVLGAVERPWSSSDFGQLKGKNGTGLPLFEKYQFFTPGIFMVFFAVFVLLSILYVGLTALSSLQVSYGAFEKEMGPAAQKK